MEEYTPNSHRYKETHAGEPKPEKRVDKVVSGVVKTKKKGEMQKFAEGFFADDVGTLKSYCIHEVLFPIIKNGLAEFAKNTIDVFFFGNTVKASGKRSGVSRVSYDSCYDRDDRRRKDYSAMSRGGRYNYDYDDIVLDNRGEAEEVLEQLDALIEQYDVVSIADLYDLVGLESRFTDHKYGWTNIKNAQAIRVRDGYLLKLPKAVPI